MPKPKRKLPFVHMIGEGIGVDFALALAILVKSIFTIDFKIKKLTDKKYRLPTTGEFNRVAAETIRTFKYCLKGPTRTAVGEGPASVNVALRKELDLYANIRPVKHFEGVEAPVKNPHLLNVVIFRENTEDVYMGIGAEPGSDKANKLFSFLGKSWKMPKGDFTSDLKNTGVAIKLISKKGSERIMEAAIHYALKSGRYRIGIAHKGNIMKETEGKFMKWCLAYAKEKYGDMVYFKGDTLSKQEKKGKIFIDTVIADNAFEELAIHPERFDIIVTMNLNGDYLSDAAAALVGGIPTAAGGNIGDTCAVFEAIGGTGDDIAGKNKANPTAYFLACAMMLEHAGFETEAKAIRDSIAYLFKQGIGTKDMKLKRRLSTTGFARQVAKLVKSSLKLAA